MTEGVPAASKRPQAPQHGHEEPTPGCSTDPAAAQHGMARPHEEWEKRSDGERWTEKETGPWGWENSPAGERYK